MDARSRKGTLLSISPFDDGRCGRGNAFLPCPRSFSVTLDVVTGSVYSIYWLWDYSGRLGNGTEHIEVCSAIMLYLISIDVDEVSITPLVWTPTLVPVNSLCCSRIEWVLQSLLHL